MIDPHSLYLLIAAFVAVVGLILLVAVAKLNPFITLLVVSLALAVAAGMPPDRNESAWYQHVQNIQVLR